MSKDDSIKDPEDHGTASTFATYLNIVCIIAGSGTLSLPKAVAQGGWVSLSFFIFTALATIYTSHLLISCLYCKKNERLEQFADIGEASFGKTGRYLAKLFHYSVSLSSPTVYIYLTGENVFASFKILYGQEVLSRPIWSMIGAVVILIPFALAKTLKEVALLGLFGTFSTGVCVGVVAIYGGLSAPAVAGITETLVSSTLGSSLAIIAFAYGGTVCFPHVEVSMRNPKAWTSVVAYGVATSTVFYFIISITAYTYFGNMVDGNVLRSLHQGVVAVVVYLLITLHVLVAAPIFLASFALEQENILKITVNHMSPAREFLIRVAFRTTILVILTLFAIFVPNLTSLTGLAGAIANCMTIFIIPIVCHFKLYGWRNRYFWEIPFAISILIVGCFGLVVGTVDTIKDWGK